MKIKGIPYSEVKKKAFENEAVFKAYIMEKKEEELQELLNSLRDKAGLNSSQVAQRMGITQPAVSRLERNASKASILTLEKYAKACGATLTITAS